MGMCVQAINNAECYYRWRAIPVPDLDITLDNFRKIKVWDLVAALNPQSPANSLCLQTLNQHTGRVFRLQFDEFQIVSSSHDDTILIWDFLETGANQVVILNDDFSRESSSETELIWWSHRFYSNIYVYTRAQRLVRGYVLWGGLVRCFGFRDYVLCTVTVIGVGVLSGGGWVRVPFVGRGLWFGAVVWWPLSGKGYLIVSRVYFTRGISVGGITVSLALVEFLTVGLSMRSNAWLWFLCGFYLFWGFWTIGRLM